MSDDFATTGTQLYSQFIHKSRYARWLDDENRRETWDETVDRYINFFKNKYPDAVDYQEIRDAIYNVEVMPSMRALMTAGPALEKCNVSGYNCSYVTISHPRAFDEMMYCLMSGVGVGFSVERQYISKLPEVAEKLYPTDSVIVVPDSRRGWCKSFKELISLLYSGCIPTWDLSKLRKEGERLKTFGGRSSGPRPLDELFKFTVSTFKRAAGRKLTSLECHDLCCKIAEIVVAGGVRRSALISLSNPSDDRMRDAKAGQWWVDNGQRALSNNSASYTEKPDFNVFLKEWQALYASKSGERGFFSRYAAQKKAAENGLRSNTVEYGCNPCSEIILRPEEFCVGSSTPLITHNGIQTIKSCKDKEVTVWNGQEWTPVTVRQTGENQELMRVWLSDGSYLDCTPDHRWSVKTRFQTEYSEVQTRDLKSVFGGKYALQVEPANVKAPLGGDSVKSPYTLGFAVGDGCVYNKSVLIDLHGSKDWECPVEGSRHQPRWNNTKTSEFVRVNATSVVDYELVSELKSSFNSCFSWNKESILQFLAGLADADGSITSSGGIRIYLSGEERARMLQLLLTKNGLKSSVCLVQREGTATNLAIRKQDLWYLQITECKEIPCHRLNTAGGHSAKFKGKYQTIREVEFLVGLHDTYCFNEPKLHKGLFANVLTYQCNLSEVIVRSTDTLEDLKRKVRIATIIGTLQSTLTDFAYLRSSWKRNCEEERLLGVSLTGIQDHKVLGTVADNHWSCELQQWLTEMKAATRQANAEAADKLGISHSTAITTVKPSGTVSQLTNTASGIHARFSKYYIRRVRADINDPLAQFMVESGFPYDVDVTNPKSLVFDFPIVSPDNAKVVADVSAIDQLRIWKIYQDYWCDHKPSCTVYYSDDEFLEVGSWLWNNFDDVSGISFLPKTDHIYQQAPYEEITKEKYLELEAKIPKSIDWVKLSSIEKEDHTTGSQALACSGNSCDIVDLTSN